MNVTTFTDLSRICADYDEPAGKERTGVTTFTDMTVTLDPLPVAQQVRLTFQSAAEPENSVTWDMSVTTAARMIRRLRECLNDLEMVPMVAPVARK